MLKNHQGFIKYFKNTSWLMLDKVIGMGMVFIVTIFVARYLEPEQFGALSYAVSLVSIFAVAGHLGLAGLVVREIVKYPEKEYETLGTSFGLKLIGILIGIISLIIFAINTEDVNDTLFWLITIISFSLLFQSFEVIDFWFNAHVRAKYTSIARLSSTLVASIYKLVLVFFASSLIYFAYANILQTIVLANLLLYFYNKQSSLKITEWKFSFSRSKELLSQGWLILLGTVFSIIYLKIDQVMLKWLSSIEEVGVYAVASSLSEAWYFIPAAIVASVFPKLIKLKESNEVEYNKRLQQLFDVLFVLALVSAIFISLISNLLIESFFGLKYLDSVVILNIHIWAGIFIFMRAAFSRWILIENALVFSLITQGLGGLSNVVLNYFLIPQYGGVGAAIATLMSYAMASYFSLLFSSKTRPVFFMMSKAFLSPLRYTILYRKAKYV
jgi:O-antigen/teichoic acid export membrane protein